MNDRTVSSKLNRLVQKSRQAYRIYASMLKNAKSEGNLYSELQASQWMKINHELVRQLSQIIELRQFKNLSHSIGRIRLELESELSQAQQDLNKEQQDLIDCSNRGEFIRCAELSTKLISKKSFIQAGSAAIYELSIVCGSHSGEIPVEVNLQTNKWQHLNQQSGADSLSRPDQSKLNEKAAIIEETKILSPKKLHSKGDFLSENHSAKVIQLRR